MNDFNDYDGKSRSQLKRESAAIQVLGEKLAGLAPSQLDRIPLSDHLRQAIDATPPAKKREARRRHLQYLGKLMREVEDIAPIAEAVQDIEEGRQANAHVFHELEELRDQLMGASPEDLNAMVERIVERNPDAERARLRQLAHNARVEREKGKPPKAYRALFRYLRDISGEQ